DGFFAGSDPAADDDILVAYWTGKEIGARQPAEYLAEGREVVNYNDEFLYYVLGEPQTFVYPTGERIYEQWTPRVVRGTEP
ncbi:beta-N-acetylglucosaminidase, partial [Streptomyces sp. TRM76130]|nr:beta-N-acetylglucosaminidase [Streptomyces sp. TRM76130]